jgi:LysM domain
MPSLSAHLRLPEDHSRLPFHPACPICRRDRLSGSLDGDELVSRRTQAVIAAGLLAFSAGGVPAAVASPPDEVIEGTSEVGVGTDPSSSVDFEPPGETPQLPDVALVTPDAVVPATEVDEDAGPLEQEPATEIPEPVVDTTTDDAAAPPAVPPPAAATPAPVETPAPAPPPAAEEAQPVQAAQGGPRADDDRAREPVRDDAPEAAAPPAPPPQPVVAEPVTAAEPAPAHDPAPAAAPEPAAEPTTVRVVARSSGNRAAPGDRVHVVRPGESLWSIAADVLGERASVASLAREVNRLWELNDDRIGTGNPDLLFAGTRLRL